MHRHMKSFDVNVGGIGAGWKDCFNENVLIFVNFAHKIGS